MTLKVAVLYGGVSTEREVSLKSGEAVYKALMAKGYQAIKVDTANNDFIEQLKKYKPDVAFLALHGKYGEDGTIQGLLEILGIPYTGSGVLASSVAMNKITTKKLLRADSIPTPDFCTYTRQDIEDKGWDYICHEIVGRLSLPVVVKAPTQGSTIGVSFAKNHDQLPKAMEESFKYDPIVLVEKFIAGKEITVTVLGNNQLEVLPQIEIVSATGFYDYHAKYTAGMSEHIIPPRIPQPQQDLIADLALKTYRLIGCRGLGRVDFIVTESGKAYVLEVNTLPGMTEVSLVPDSAKAAGIEFPALVEKLVNLALE